GLAADLGVPIIKEPRLSEEGYLADPAGSLHRLIEIAGEPGSPAVVCSQGEVIPNLVSTLTEEAGLDLVDIPSRKGSFWGLFFGSESPTRPVLLTADYYNDALG
ncbi:MAG: NUDIX hydrolase, partial [Pseudonocardiaceae bacterium]